MHDDARDRNALPVAKSTFTAPASATDGLQSYNLEGSQRRRKRRKRSSGDATQETLMPNDALKLFIPITKVDAAKRLVYGMATAELPDISGEVCDYATTKPLYEKWSAHFDKVTDGKSLGNLRAMHGNVAAGKLTSIAFNDEAKKIEICGHVVDDNEWKKCEEGVYTGFSQGGKYIKRWKDGDVTKYTAEPIEVSLVDAPCLKEATFEIIKADGSTELRKFKETPAASPTAAEIVIKAQELARSAGNESKWADHIEAATKALTATATPVVVVEPVAKGGDAPNDNEVGEQVWVNDKLPGQTFKKKAELRQALLDLDAETAAKKQAGPVLEALAGIKDMLVKQNGGDAAAETGKTAVAAAKIEVPAGDGVAKKDYSDDDRKDMAAKGEALKDGSFPIKDKSDLENAVKAFGRAKNKAAAKRHIIKRAKALKATDLLPADWPGSTKDKDASKVAGDGDLSKGADLWSISDLLLLLDGVSRAENNAELPAWGFGNSVELPKDLCDRFGAALIEIGDIAAEMLDAVLSSMKEEEAHEAINMAALAADLVKLAGDRKRLAKAGAKHSAADKDKIVKAHDLLVDLDPDCCPAEDDDDAEKLVKTLTAERNADRKAFTAELSAIHDVVKQLAAQPLPMGSSSVTLRTVEKGHDFGSIADNLGAASTDPDGLTRLASTAVRVAQTMSHRG
jgi:hypothetical protein